MQDAPERDAPLLDKGPLVMAGIAAGLAASVKLTFLVPVGGDRDRRGPLQRPRPALDHRLGDGPADASSSAATGTCGRRSRPAATRSRIPASGRCNLPTPDQMPLDPRPRFAVAHYLTDPTIYRKLVLPRSSTTRFGPLWPLILIIAVAAAVYIALRSRNRILRVIAAAALLTAVVYIFTPLTAAGQEGSPTGFFTNTRYLVPGLVLAMVLLPIARPLRAPDRRAWQTLLFLTGGLRDHGADDAALVPGLHRRHDLPHPGPGLGAGGARAGARRAARSAAAVVAARGGAVLLLAVVLGRAQEVQYAEHHYTEADPVPAGRRAAEGLRLRPQPARQADRDRRLGRDLLRPVRLLRRRPRQLRPVHRRAGAERHLPAGDQLPRSSAAGSTPATTTT